MKLIATVSDLRAAVRQARGPGSRIGCVPTMGALHEGHGVLIDRCRELCDLLVVTVFVNPIQFDRREDYEAYGRNLPADLQFCESRRADVVFAPSVEEMYPEPMATFVEVPDVAKHLCGEFRPGHFRGVATVVAKLFQIVQPDVACFGEKDLQQLAVIRRMVQDLSIPVEIVGVETVREPDGLAMSSRNVRLSPEQRRAGTAVYRALCAARTALVCGERDVAAIRNAALSVLKQEPLLRTEYLEVVDAAMQPAEWVNGPVHIAAAVWAGGTRLIDNLSWPADLPADRRENQ